MSRTRLNSFSPNPRELGWIRYRERKNKGKVGKRQNKRVGEGGGEKEMVEGYIGEVKFHLGTEIFRSGKRKV